MSAKQIFYSQLLIALALIAALTYTITSLQEVYNFLIEDSETVIYLTIAQLEIFLLSASFAVFFAFWTGFLLSRKSLYNYSNFFMQFFNICMAIPTLAMLALAMLIFDIGFFSAWLALVLITLMPVVRNTFNAFNEIDPAQIDAAKGMGMNSTQIFLRVEFPQALPLVFAGIRTGLIFNIGSLPLIFLISADGLGELIFIGLRLNDYTQILIGSGLTALMAIIIDVIIHVTSFFIISKGITQTA